MLLIYVTFPPNIDAYKFTWSLLSLLIEISVNNNLNSNNALIVGTSNLGSRQFEPSSLLFIMQFPV